MRPGRGRIGPGRPGAEAGRGTGCRGATSATLLGSLVAGLLLAGLGAADARAIVIRHDVEDRAYRELGGQYSASVAYAGGCAATVLAPSWLLTAAHCTVGREERYVSARHLGSDYRIERLIPHPRYDRADHERFDIALIRLQDPIPDARPARIFRGRDEVGRVVVFVGRGTFGNGRDGLLREDGIERGATNEVVGATERILEFVFDAPGDATELEGISSRGDSGGPAFLELDSGLYVLGVSSYQQGRGHPEGTYGVSEHYSRVSTYADWLDSAMEGTEPPEPIARPPRRSALP